MKKIVLFRTIAILIILFNILNYFFLAASYSGGDIITSSTFFDHTMLNFTTSEDFIAYKFHISLKGGGLSDNQLIIGFIIPLIDIFLGAIILFFTPKCGDYMQIPYKRIFVTCGIGIIFHSFLFIFCGATTDVAYFILMFKGMILNLLYIIGYIVIIEMFRKIKVHKITYNEEYKTKLNIFDVAVIGILIELFLAFIYVTLVRRLIITGINRDGQPYKRYYGNFYFSQLLMMFKQKDYGLPGKVEGYPYMVICLIIIVIQMVLTILKTKYRQFIVIALSIVSIVVMTIGLNDIRDSFYVCYISDKGNGFFDIAGSGYYFIIALNLSLIIPYVWPKGNVDCIVIGAKEIEDIVNAETIRKKEKETENLLIIEDNSSLEENKGDDINEEDA